MNPIEVTKMWSKDVFDVSTDRLLRKSARIQNGYQITCDPSHNEIDLANSPGLPFTGDPFPGLPDLFAVNRAFTRISPIYWVSVITYEGTNIDPIGEPPEISWSDTETDEPIDQDWDGEPIVTANGEPIEGVTMKVADLVLTVRRNYRFFSPALTHAYRHSVNSDTFAGFPAGTGRLTKFSAKQNWYEPNNGYWDVTASVQFRYPYNTTPDKAWYARVRHEGFYEKVDGNIVRAVDDHKEPTTRPVLLAQTGERELDPSNAYWLEIKRYQSLPYAALGLL